MSILKAQSPINAILEKNLIFFYQQKDVKASQRTLTFHRETLRRLFEILEVKDDFLNIDNVKDYDNITNILNSKYSSKLNTIKSFIKSILIFIQMVKPNELDLLLKYRAYLKSLTSDIDKKENIKLTNETLTVSKKDIVKIYENYTNLINKMLINDKINFQDKRIIQKYLISCLYSGVFIPILRNNYVNMKITTNYASEINKNKFNYYDTNNNQIILNSYKTFKEYGQKVKKLPDNLDFILKKYIPHIANEKGFIFVDLKKNRPYTNDTFSKMIARVFKGVGINVLRKVYITEKYSHIRKLQRSINEDCDFMGNSSDIIKKTYAYENIKT